MGFEFSLRSESKIGRFAVGGLCLTAGWRHGHGILVGRSLVPLNPWATVAHTLQKLELSSETGPVGTFKVHPKETLRTQFVPKGRKEKCKH